jgi:trehalose-6-phosphate synthase
MQLDFRFKCSACVACSWLEGEVARLYGSFGVWGVCGNAFLIWQVRWVGCVGLNVTKEEEDALAEYLLDEYNCVVVYLDEILVQDFYQGFCRNYLRPIFHCQATR